MIVLDSIVTHLDVDSGRVSLLSPYLHYTLKEIDSELQSVRLTAFDFKRCTNIFRKEERVLIFEQ